MQSLNKEYGYSKIKPCYLIVVAMLLFCHNLCASYNFDHSSPRSSGMGGISVMLSDNWSNFNNQAGLGAMNGISAGTIYNSKYGLSQLSTKALAVSIPITGGVAGFNFSYFGYSKYNESKYAFAFGKRLHEVFFAGVQIDYYNIHISDSYGNKGLFTAEFGLLSKPLKNFYIGFHIFNPAHQIIQSELNEHLPTIMKFGAGIYLKKTTLLGFEAEKRTNQQAQYKLGAEHLFYDFFFIRAGTSLNPAKFGFGTGFIYQQFRLDFSFINHPELGYSPNISLIYAIKEKNKPKNN
jgi:hypothetical protein